MGHELEGRDLLAQHIAMMDGGLAAARASDDARMRAEAERVAAVRLKPLSDVGVPRPRGAFRFVPAALAAAAALILLLWPRAPERDLQLKGGAGSTRVWLVWERDGQALEWRGDAAVQDGDRFTAEVTAGSESVAFIGVYDAAGRLLSDPTRMRASRMDLAPGERRRFPGAFELTGADEGEHLVVFVCDAAAFAASGGRLPEPGAAGDACATSSHRLR